MLSACIKGFEADEPELAKAVGDTIKDRKAKEDKMSKKAAAFFTAVRRIESASVCCVTAIVCTCRRCIFNVKLVVSGIQRRGSASLS